MKKIIFLMLICLLLLNGNTIAEEKTDTKILKMKAKELRSRIEELDNLNLYIKVEWIDGRLYYNVQLKPATNRLFEMWDEERTCAFHERKNPAINLNLYDAEHNKLFTKALLLIEMLPTFDDKGNKSSLVHEGNVEFGGEAYKKIHSGDITWYFPEY